MDLLKRERIRLDMSDGMNSRWVVGNRRNTRTGRSAGSASGGVGDRGRRQSAGTTTLRESPAGQPWKGIRMAKVAKAKMLVRDGSYPSRQVMESVAGLLAKHLGTRE
jgi:hypothetical protein